MCLQFVYLHCLHWCVDEEEIDPALLPSSIPDAVPSTTGVLLVCLQFVYLQSLRWWRRNGKSSLLNLILGEDLLPVAHMRSTLLMCELKYGDECVMTAYFKDKSKPKVVYSFRGKELESIKQEIQKIVVAEGEAPENLKYGKIELQWPHPLLKVTNPFDARASFFLRCLAMWPSVTQFSRGLLAAVLLVSTPCAPPPLLGEGHKVLRPLKRLRGDLWGMYLVFTKTQCDVRQNLSEHAGSRPKLSSCWYVALVSSCWDTGVINPF